MLGVSALPIYLAGALLHLTILCGRSNRTTVPPPPHDPTRKKRTRDKIIKQRRAWAMLSVPEENVR